MSTEKSVSKLVREILDQDPSLVHELQQRKTAQREIAKRIKNKISDLGEFKEIDSIRLEKLEGNIAVAITRYLKKLRDRQDELLGIKRVQNILKKGTTEVIDGLKHYKINFHEDADTFEVLKNILAHLGREEISSVTISPNGFSTYVKKMSEESFLNVLNGFKGIDVHKLQSSLSLLKLMLPMEAAEVPGILAHVSSLLADQAISLYDTMVYHSDLLSIIFVINEQNASKARDILLKLNNESMKS